MSDRIDRLVEAEMERDSVPGVALAVVQGGTVVKAQGMPPEAYKEAVAGN